jgi:hypothetical protein
VTKEMFEAEPEAIDEDDPEVENELFETMKEIGIKPSNLVDPRESARYGEWLKLSNG